jgi:hypothetical protein
VIAVTLYVSHHISGPLYAIRRYLESISRGELDFQPKLRDDDQTTALTESLAHALETLNSRLISIRGSADAVREASARLPRHLESADAASAECRRDLSDLLAREDALVATWSSSALPARALGGRAAAGRRCARHRNAAGRPASGPVDHGADDSRSTPCSTKVGCTYCHLAVPGQGRAMCAVFAKHRRPLPELPPPRSRTTSTTASASAPR